MARARSRAPKVSVAPGVYRPRPRGKALVVKKKPAPDPLRRTLDIAERLLAEGREEQALVLVGRVLDVLDERAKEARRQGWRK